MIKKKRKKQQRAQCGWITTEHRQTASRLHAKMNLKYSWSSQRGGRQNNALQAIKQYSNSMTTQENNLKLQMRSNCCKHISTHEQTKPPSCLHSWLLADADVLSNFKKENIKLTWRTWLKNLKNTPKQQLDRELLLLSELTFAHLVNSPCHRRPRPRECLLIPARPHPPATCTCVCITRPSEAARRCFSILWEIGDELKPPT